MLRFRYIVVVAAGAILFSNPAAAYYRVSGTFTATASCPAVTSIRSGANPDSAMVEPGKSYAVRGLNKAGGSHVDLVIPGASGGARWVDLNCGTLSTSAPLPAGPQGNGASGAFLPFFDTRDDGPNDPTPPPPVLGAFDRAVLEVCGPWGSTPTEAGFRQILDRPDLESDVARIYEVLNRSVVGDGPEALPEFKGRLTQLWFRAAGFAHIFCAEPGLSPLGGLHFAGRYLQAQEQGWAGRAPDALCNPAQREIVPPIYTFGVEYLGLDGKRRSHCQKGYPYGMDASTMLVEATRAMKSMKGEVDKRMCLMKLKAPDHDYYAVSVIKDRGVRTFYPDASPACNGGGAVSTCACSM